MVMFPFPSVLFQNRFFNFFCFQSQRVHFLSQANNWLVYVSKQSHCQRSCRSSGSRSWPKCWELPRPGPTAGPGAGTILAKGTMCTSGAKILTLSKGSCPHSTEVLVATFHAQTVRGVLQLGPCKTVLLLSFQNSKPKTTNFIAHG